MLALLRPQWVPASFSHGVSESSLKCGFELNTTPSQVVAIQLLYYALFSDASSTSKPPSKRGASPAEEVASSSSSPTETSHTISRGTENLMETLKQLPRLSKLPSEPAVSFEPDVPKLLGHSIVSENYIPSQTQGAKLFQRFTLLPVNIVWKFRKEVSDALSTNPVPSTIKSSYTSTELPIPAEESQVHLELHFSELEARYDVDENNASLLEVKFKTVDGYSYLNGDRGMHFFGFDQNAGVFRRNCLFFSLSSCLRRLEAVAQRLSHDALASSHSASLSEFLSLQRANEGPEILEGDDSRVARFRLVVSPMQITCNVQTFPFMHSFYRSYASLLDAIDPPANNEDSSFMASLFDSIAASLSLGYADHRSSPDASIPAFGVHPNAVEVGNESKELLGGANSSTVASPFFRSFYVGDLHLRLNLPGVDDAKVRLPSVISHDVQGWRAVGEELTSAYAPFLNEALGSVIASFPGVKLVRVVGMSLYQLVQVPLEERKYNRSVTYGFVKTLGSSMWNVATETVALTSQVMGFAQRGIGMVGSIFDQRTPNSPSTQEQNAHMTAPADMSDGASKGYQVITESLHAASDNLKAPLERFHSDDGSVWVLIKDVPLSLPGTIIMPISGVVKGAGVFLQGTAAYMKSDHTTIPDSRPHVPSSSSSATSLDHSSSEPSD